MRLIGRNYKGSGIEVGHYCLRRDRRAFTRKRIHENTSIRVNLAPEIGMFKRDIWNRLEHSKSAIWAKKDGPCSLLRGVLEKGFRPALGEEMCSPQILL